MEYTIFICTDKKQYLGALLSKYTIERYSENLDKFSIKIIESDENLDLKEVYGKEILKDGTKQIYSADDLQAFTLTRFLPPEIMNYSGRAVVIDPDIFATYHDIWELLSKDMGGNAILCKKGKSDKDPWATSVMLLDCEKLKHWSIKGIVDDLISQKKDYRDWMSLRTESAKVGVLEEEWNHFDTLTDDTKLIHNTLRITQPWRTGLKLDYKPKKMKKFLRLVPREWIHFAVGKNPYKHRKHPDQKQIEFIFGHLKSAIIEGEINKDTIINEINLGHIRKDALEVVERTDRL